LVIRHLRAHNRDLLAKLYPTLKPYIECVDSRPSPVGQRKLLLTTHLSPGDIMTLTAAVECVKMSYGDEYHFGVDTSCQEIWQFNPHIEQLDPGDPEVGRLQCEYPLVHQSNQAAVSFLAGYLDYIARVIGKPVPLRTNRPHLYLSDEERCWIGRIEEIYGEYRPYWVVNAGIKSDYTCKQWPVEYYQEVINRTRDKVLWVQVGEAGHTHKPLENCVVQIGETTPRELIRLVYHAQGGLGPVTFLQHLCAAWQKPYLCLLGGREPVSWTAYPLQQTLHSIGSLDCCRETACWKSRVVRLEDGAVQDESLCEHPMLNWAQPVAQCMSMITPDLVLAHLERYFSCCHL